MDDKIKEIRNKVSQVDIAFHLNAIELTLTKITILMAAPEIVISDYVIYKAKKEAFNYQEFYDWCKTRRVKLYAERKNKSVLSSIKAYWINRKIKKMGLLLDKEIISVWMIVNKPEIIENIPEERKQKILKYIEEKVDNILMYGY